ncbi:peroxiredoxin-2e-2 chloroplastic, partial [Phtheirospermum japonicum]
RLRRAPDRFYLRPHRQQKKHHPHRPRHVHPILLAEAPPRLRPVSRRAQGQRDKHHFPSLGQRFTARNLHTTIWRN